MWPKHIAATHGQVATFRVHSDAFREHGEVFRDHSVEQPCADFRESKQHEQFFDRRAENMRKTNYLVGQPLC